MALNKGKHIVEEIDGFVVRWLKKEFHQHALNS